MRIKSQIYSEMVFEHVNEVAALQKPDNEKNNKIARRYKSLCKRAGGIFRTVGLVQFTTFIEAKGKKDVHYEKLSRQLQTELKDLGIVISDTTIGYLEKIRKLSLPEYMQVSQVVLQLLLWHKRMSEILIAGEEDDRTDKGA